MTELLHFVVVDEVVMCGTVTDVQVMYRGMVKTSAQRRLIRAASALDDAVDEM